MNQSTVIAAALLAGFVLFLAAKGRLSAYTAVLWGNTPAALPSAGAAQAAGSSAGSSAGSLAQILPAALAVLA